MAGLDLASLRHVTQIYFVCLAHRSCAAVPDRDDRLFHARRIDSRDGSSNDREQGMKERPLRLAAAITAVEGSDPDRIAVRLHPDLVPAPRHERHHARRAAIGLREVSVARARHSASHLKPSCRIAGARQNLTLRARTVTMLGFAAATAFTNPARASGARPHRCTPIASGAIDTDVGRALRTTLTRIAVHDRIPR